MLSRDIFRLTSEEFDLLVIGGGVGGAAISYEAAARGLSVAVIDRNDFGAETSAGNFKTLHGGLRYLQHLDLSRLYESVREQRYFLRAAPQLTAPLPFLVPCYGYGFKSRELLEIAMLAYRVLTPHRNRSLPANHRFPKPQTLTVDETLRHAPHLQRSGLRGGVVFYDAVMTDADRLTLAFVASAARAGAVSANYVEAVGGTIIEDQAGNRRISEVQLRDRIDGRKFEVRTRAVVNATGPWCDRLSAILVGGPAHQSTPARVFSKGIQVVLPPFLATHALAVESRYADRTANISRGNRSYFFLPWNGSTLLGTADIVHTDNPDNCEFRKEEVEAFLDDARKLYPDSRLSIDHVHLVFGGLRPVDRSVEERFARGELAQTGSIETRRRDRLEFHTEVSNLLLVEGIKYTTARSVAERAIDLLRREFMHLRPSNTLNLPLIVAPELAEHERGAPLSDGVYEGEIVRAVRTESVLRLADVVLRRTKLGARGYPGTDVLVTTTRIVQQHLGWTTDEARSELGSLLHYFSNRVFDSDSRNKIAEAMRLLTTLQLSS